MRVLILSDIHANFEALDAVLSAAPTWDLVWNLGDIVGYGASPNEVIDQVRALGEVFVRGNHDRVCAGLSSMEDFNPIASRAAKWTQLVLTPEHVLWLQGLAAGPVMPDGPQVSCMHGSPFDEDEYVLSMRDAWGPLHEIRTRINFFGHTHLQGGFAANGESLVKLNPRYSHGRGSEEYEVPLRAAARYMINPGSVGQPRDHDWRAAFAIYDDDKMTVSFCRVPYDVRAAQMRILQAGLPDRLATRLREGR